jgi:hypothetical protein
MAPMAIGARAAHSGQVHRHRADARAQQHMQRLLVSSRPPHLQNSNVKQNACRLRSRHQLLIVRSQSGAVPADRTPGALTPHALRTAAERPSAGLYCRTVSETTRSLCCCWLDPAWVLLACVMSNSAASRNTKRISMSSSSEHMCLKKVCGVLVTCSTSDANMP